MSATWFSADTHFMHRFVAELRGFASPEEHGEAIISGWNKAVRPDDLVWHLGDVGLGNEQGILNLATWLNGRKQLIAGNHDACWPGHRDSRKHQRRWLEVFESVQAFARIRIDGRTVLLSHFPRTGDHTEIERHDQFRLRPGADPILHGHTHSQERGGGDQIHVGLDAWDLRPVREDELVKLLNVNRPDPVDCSI